MWPRGHAARGVPGAVVYCLGMCLCNAYTVVCQSHWYSWNESKLRAKLISWFRLCYGSQTRSCLFEKSSLEVMMCARVASVQIVWLYVCLCVCVPCCPHICQACASLQIRKHHIMPLTSKLELQHPWNTWVQSPETVAHWHCPAEKTYTKYSFGPELECWDQIKRNQMGKGLRFPYLYPIITLLSDKPCVTWMWGDSTPLHSTPLSNPLLSHHTNKANSTHTHTPNPQILPCLWFHSWIDFRSLRRVENVTFFTLGLHFCHNRRKNQKSRSSRRAKPGAAALSHHYFWYTAISSVPVEMTAERRTMCLHVCLVCVCMCVSGEREREI